MRITALLIALLLPLVQAQAAERILALSPHACEILAAIGAGEEIVGVVDYCDYPQSLSQLPNLGGYNRIQVESAMQLKPTLAIVMNDGTPVVNKLRSLGVRVVVSNPVTIDAMLSEIERIGKLSGHGDQAHDLVSSLSGRLSGIRRNTPPVKTLYEIWPDPLIASGGASLINDVMTRVGLENVFASIPQEGPKVNVEAVIRAAPDLIIVPGENRDVVKRERFWKKWLGEDVQVVAIDADLLHRPTPRLIDGIESLQRLIQQVTPDVETKGE